MGSLAPHSCLPLAILVFLGAYIPLVGAFVSGLLAVAVTFVNGGLGSALIVLVVVIAVQQFEGDVIMPIVFGQTLKLHPLVILLGIAVGGLAFGLFGAFLSVPLIAVAGGSQRRDIGPSGSRSSFHWRGA